MDKKPTVDPAEDNAFFPSRYSLQQYTSAKTDFDGLKFKTPYRGGKWKVLMVATDERYLLMRNGAFFSTGNHPVEMLLPMHHMDQAGFPIDVATLSGNPVKLEMWAMPNYRQMPPGPEADHRRQPARVQQPWKARGGRAPARSGSLSANKPIRAAPADAPHAQCIYVSWI